MYRVLQGKGQVQAAWQGEAREEVQVSTGGGAGGRAKWLEEAKEDIRGEQYDGRDTEGGSKSHHGCLEQIGEAPPGASGVGGG